jgi:hypothetical protein
MGCPKILLAKSERERAEISVAPPAAKQTTQLIGLSGYSANAEDGIASIMVINIDQIISLFIGTFSFLF